MASFTRIPSSCGTFTQQCCERKTRTCPFQGGGSQPISTTFTTINNPSHTPALPDQPNMRFIRRSYHNSVVNRQQLRCTGEKFRAEVFGLWGCSNENQRDMLLVCAPSRSCH